jgi:hypothetical protein
MTIPYRNGKAGIEQYKTIDGSVFSGKFEFIDSVNNVKQIRKIKNGLRNGTTQYINLSTNKTIKKEKYKDGVLK